jgi:hypothetical protein
MLTSKRMVLTVGDSRVGKSTIARLLIELFVEHQKRLKVYDHDTRNKLDAYKNIVPIDSLNFFTGDTDQILDDINEEQFDLILVDMPGQYIDEICNYVDEVDFFTVVADYNWRITLMQPISQRIDCLKYMEKILSLLKYKYFDFVVIKNYYFDERFIEFANFKAANFKLVGGGEIKLGKLHRDHYDLAEKANKPFSEIVNDLSFQLLYRSYIHRWLEEFNQSVLNSSDKKHLGLEDYVNRRSS